MSLEDREGPMFMHSGTFWSDEITLCVPEHWDELTTRLYVISKKPECSEQTLKVEVMCECDSRSGYKHLKVSRT